jgi:predicted DNA-binding protein (MmcQ/YjbR family)
MALPEVTEKLAWGEPTWRVRDRLFAMFDDHHHGAAHVAVWLATEREAQEALIEAEPARFFRPPYLGPAGWIGAVLTGDCNWDMVTAVIEQAYHRIAAKGPARRRAAAAAPKARPAAPAARRARTAPGKGSPSKASGKGSPSKASPSKASGKGSPSKASPSKASGKGSPSKGSPSKASGKGSPSKASPAVAKPARKTPARSRAAGR